MGSILFPTLSEKELLVAIVRKLRVHQTKFGGRTAPEGTDFRKFHDVVVESGLFKHDDYDRALRLLLATHTITLFASFNFHSPNRSEVKRTQGIVTALHPDSLVRNFTYYTESFTPIVEKRRKEDKARIYPNNKTRYWWLYIQQIYVTGDGLPETVKKMKPIFPVT